MPFILIDLKSAWYTMGSFIRFSTYRSLKELSLLSQNQEKIINQLTQYISLENISRL